jgi:hypothetical protein
VWISCLDYTTVAKSDHQYTDFGKKLMLLKIILEYETHNVKLFCKGEGDACDI